MESLALYLSDFRDIVWGVPMILLLLGTHIYLTYKTGFIQRKVPLGIKLSITKDSGSAGDVSQFQALTTALASTIGTGNIIGVGTAVYLGGNSASGGEGSVWRTFMGILIIGILNNGMALLSVQSYWQTFFKGCLLIIAVIFDMLRRR